MSDAWGGAWGVAWGASWGDGGAAPIAASNFSLREWRKWHAPEDEKELTKLGITPAAAEIIAAVAESQAKRLEIDDQKRLEELSRELELAGVQWQGRHLELLNQQREMLITEEIASLMERKIDDEKALLTILAMI